ncbi:MAG: TolC family protein [Candidatus Solibacter usitatus]|nr:TolC family protein [Candidatus Solibacter usitatus]
MRKEAPAHSLDELNQQAIRLRPDLTLLRQGQTRSQADLRLQLSNRTVDYTIGTEYRRSQTPGGANSMGFFVSVPLALHNKNQGEIARAEREFEQGQSRIRAMELGVQTDVRQAWQQYQTASNMLKDIEMNMLAKAKSVRDTLEYSYRITMPAQAMRAVCI